MEQHQPVLSLFISKIDAEQVFPILLVGVGGKAEPAPLSVFRDVDPDPEGRCVGPAVALRQQERRIKAVTFSARRAGKEDLTLEYIAMPGGGRIGNHLKCTSGHTFNTPPTVLLQIAGFVTRLPVGRRCCRRRLKRCFRPGVQGLRRDAALRTLHHNGADKDG